ncbi:spore maturation protein [Anaerosinus massiliensis]|uniref:spore maturation protein n=1 Tax=Massilibacillus massiliensis TaxID=1806837 RepID=UPI000A4D3453|nr:nucleoside recognition domain-containing protein [Massilibacillus massiliensis]
MILELCTKLSVWAIPMIVVIILLGGLLAKVKVYETFVEGASEGFYTAIRIMPFLVAMMVSVSVFRDSGALQVGIHYLSPILDSLGIPKELVPLGVMKPLSGTGALGIASELINRFGPDSLYGRIASVVVGCTDTTFYILTVYFGSVGIIKLRYSLYVGLVGDIVGFFTSIYLCNLIFSY